MRGKQYYDASLPSELLNFARTLTTNAPETHYSPQRSPCDINSPWAPMNKLRCDGKYRCNVTKYTIETTDDLNQRIGFSGYKYKFTIYNIQITTFNFFLIKHKKKANPGGLARCLPPAPSGTTAAPRQRSPPGCVGPPRPPEGRRPPLRPRITGEGLPDRLATQLNLLRRNQNRPYAIRSAEATKVVPITQAPHLRVAILHVAPPPMTSLIAAEEEPAGMLKSAPIARPAPEFALYGSTYGGALPPLRF